jgi:hypothetical protein
MGSDGRRQRTLRMSTVNRQSRGNVNSRVIFTSSEISSSTKVRLPFSHYPMKPLTMQEGLLDSRWPFYQGRLEREWQDASRYIMYIMTTMM